jgi:hypothetical protein
MIIQANGQRVDPYRFSLSSFGMCSHIKISYIIKWTTLVEKNGKIMHQRRMNRIGSFLIPPCFPSVCHREMLFIEWDWILIYRWPLRGKIHDVGRVW